MAKVIHLVLVVLYCFVGDELLAALMLICQVAEQCGVRARASIPIALRVAGDRLAATDRAGLIG